MTSALKSRKRHCRNIDLLHSRPYTGTRIVLQYVLAAGSQHGVGRVNKLKNQARIHQDKEKLTHCSSRTNEHEPNVIHLKYYKNYAGWGLLRALVIQANGRH